MRRALLTAAKTSLIGGVYTEHRNATGPFTVNSGTEPKGNLWIAIGRDRDGWVEPPAFGWFAADDFNGAPYYTPRIWFSMDEAPDWGFQSAGGGASLMVVGFDIPGETRWTTANCAESPSDSTSPVSLSTVGGLNPGDVHVVVGHISGSSSNRATGWNKMAGYEEVSWVSNAGVQYFLLGLQIKVFPTGGSTGAQSLSWTATGSPTSGDWWNGKVDPV